MKCSICEQEFTSENEEQDICDECLPAVEDLCDGKGEDDDE